jgi:hypothetical protein
MIRDRAALERRTVSGYVLNILDRVLRTEDWLFQKLAQFESFNRTLGKPRTRSHGPRTALLIRCTIGEVKRIRAAAARRQIGISDFVVHSLRQVWTVAAGRLSP